jgi:5-methylcytosine-specific restriction protein B
MRDLTGRRHAAVASLLSERRFVILEGPPGTGKTRLALKVGEAIGSHEMVQFHPARTYEDFVVGLYPRVAGGELAFEVRAGDLLRANASAHGSPHVRSSTRSSNRFSASPR